MRESKLGATTVLIYPELQMSLRSELSLLQDESNFAWILAHEVRILLDSANPDITPNQRLELVCIYLRLLEADIADSAIIRELGELLGAAHTALLESQTIIRARLETDLANSCS